MRVFKYRGGEFQRDLQSLKDDYFWAPTREKLNDPCEGLFDKEPLDIQLNGLYSMMQGGKEHEESFQEVKCSIDNLLEFVNTSGVFSLSKSPCEELLWAHYARSHEGFCIEYDLDVLMNFENNYYETIDVKYANTPQKLNGLELLQQGDSKKFLQVILGAKPLSWAYENEIRVITPKAGRHDYDYRAVKTIYFGLRMDDKEKTEVMSTLRGRDIKYKQIKLIKNSYNLVDVAVEDPFGTSEKYKNSIAPIAESAITPEFEREEFQKYSDYLYKAAEIVRREPYCNEVEQVAFSGLKSTQKKPIILVQYRRKEDKWVNHYLSLQEIDAQYPSLGLI